MNNKIKAYVDILFSDIPDGYRTRELKEEILVNLDERMNDYISQGMSENKAYTKAITDMGDIDEILDELNIGSDDIGCENKNKEENDAFDYFDEDISGKQKNKEIDFEKVEEYRAKKIKLMSLGVAILILSVVSPAITEDNKYENIGILIMFLMAAIGVGIVIYSNRYSIEGLKKEYYRYNDEYFNKDEQTRYTKTEIENKEPDYIKSISSIVWSLTLIVFLCIGFLKGGWGYAWIVFIIAGIFMEIFKLMYYTRK